MYKLHYNLQKKMRLKQWLWSSSPKTLLHTITALAFLCFFLALILSAVEMPYTAPFLHTFFSSSSSLRRVLPLETAFIARTEIIEKGIEDLDDDQEAESHLPFTGFGPKITDWDQQRQAWLFQNPDFVLGDGKPKILLVTASSATACDNPYADYYLLKFSKNKIDYCRFHGIEFFYSMTQFDSGMKDSWSKLPLLRKLMLSHPEMEWIWWMDNDAIFTDMSFELPMEKYKQHNLVLHGLADEVYIKKSWMGLNAGVFLIRNCQWSLDFMDAWALMGTNQTVREEEGKVLSETLTDMPLFEADDQSALVYLLTTEKKLWESKVFLEYSYSLHGYWEAIVDRYEELMESSHPGFGDERWPFVTHFVGCKSDKCLKQMERAFNFGDNQVLQYYGLQHRNLGSLKLKRIWNETSQSLNETKPIRPEINLQRPPFVEAMIDGTIS